MTNILLVAPSGMYGGGEVYIKNLSIYLKYDNNIKVYVLASNQKLITEITPIVDGVFWSKDSASQINKISNALLIYKLVRSKKIDVVFFNGLPESGLLSFLSPAKRNVCIGHSNESDLPKIKDSINIKEIILKNIYKLSFSHLDSFICINNVSRKNLEKFNPEYQKLHVVYNGVPEISTTNKKLKGHGKLKLGRICRLTKDKNVELAIDTVTGFASGIELLVAGEGEHLSFLKEYSNDKPVTFMGHIQPEDFYKEIDVMLLTTPSSSNADATPLVIAEAMSCGIPVVSTKVGGVPEMIEDGVSGILVEDTINAFRRAVKKLLDDEYYTYLSNNARSCYEQRFTLDKTMEETKNILLGNV